MLGEKLQVTTFGRPSLIFSAFLLLVFRKKKLTSKISKKLLVNPYHWSFQQNNPRPPSSPLKPLGSRRVSPLHLLHPGDIVQGLECSSQLVPGVGHQRESSYQRISKLNGILYLYSKKECLVYSIQKKRMFLVYTKPPKIWRIILPKMRG